MGTFTRPAPRGPLIFRALVAGIVAGILTGLLAWALGAPVSDLTGVPDARLILASPMALVASLVLCTLGGIIWYFWARRFGRVSFFVLGLVLTTLYTVLVPFFPSSPEAGFVLPDGFAIPAGVLHYVVAIPALFLITGIAPRSE